MKKLTTIAAAILFTLSVSTAAYAHCGSCGVGDKPKHACKKKCKDAKDKKACVKKCKAHNKKDHKKKTK